LYVGVTNDIERRVGEHKDGAVPGFTSKYQLDRLIYFEEFASIRAAIGAGEADQALAQGQEARPNRIDES
jgi:predicted GIY-YIG superfamily endonuclease